MGSGRAAGGEARHRDYGFLIVVTQLFTEPEVLFRIPPGAFSPPPKVESAAVRLLPRPARIEDAGGFLEFAGRWFRQKRKTIRNNLLPFYGRQVDLPEARLRAEKVPIEQLIEMYRRLGRGAILFNCTIEGDRCLFLAR